MCIRDSLFAVWQHHRACADRRNVYERTAGLDRPQLRDLQLLGALVGVTEVGVVRLREDHLGIVAATVHECDGVVVEEDFEADSDALSLIHI